MATQKPLCWDIELLRQAISEQTIQHIKHSIHEQTDQYKTLLCNQPASFEQTQELALWIKQLFDLSNQTYGEFELSLAAPGLLLAIDQEDSSAQSAETVIAEILLWFQAQEAHLTEILRLLPEETLKSITNHPALSDYKHALEVILENKKFYLSEKEELLLQKTSLTNGPTTAKEILDIWLDRESKRITGKSFESVLAELHDQDRDKRKASAQTAGDICSQMTVAAALTLNSVLTETKTHQELRGYASWDDSRHKANEITAEEVQTLESVVLESLPLVSQYYELKRRVLWYETLYDYDRYAPIVAPNTSKKHYSDQEAYDMVYQAFERFSPEWADMLEQLRNQQRIDTFAHPRKSTGAFCAPTGKHLLPFVFINFNGTLDDVFTFAHEAGHAIHFVLSQKQCELHSIMSPLTLCESASLLGEELLFEYLAPTLTNDEKKQLLFHRLDAMIATVYRQMILYSFEQKIHAQRAAQGPLLPEEFGAFWLESQRNMFGNSMIVTESYKDYWVYISHFYDVPGYVYAYSYGGLFALSLMENRARNPHFYETLTSFLWLGGSKSPRELTQLFGFDTTQRAFWQAGVKHIEQMIHNLTNIINAEK